MHQTVEFRFGVLRRQGRRTFEALVDAGLNVTRGRPLDGDGVLRRCLPWLTAGLIACTFLPLLSDWPSTGDVIALSLVPVIVGTALVLPWERLPTWMQAIPPLLPFAMVALVRGSHESVTAAYTPVVLLPVIWFAFYGTRKQLLISVLGLGITLAVPSPAFTGYPALEPLGGALLDGGRGDRGLLDQRAGPSAREAAGAARHDGPHRRPHRAAQPTRLGRGARPRARRAPTAAARPSASRCWTSTTSRSSTT